MRTYEVDITLPFCRLRNRDSPRFSDLLRATQAASSLGPWFKCRSVWLNTAASSRSQTSCIHRWVARLACPCRCLSDWHPLRNCPWLLGNNQPPLSALRWFLFHLRCKPSTMVPSKLSAFSIPTHAQGPQGQSLFSIKCVPLYPQEPGYCLESHSRLLLDTVVSVLFSDVFREPKGAVLLVCCIVVFFIPISSHWVSSLLSFLGTQLTGQYHYWESSVAERLDQHGCQIGYICRSPSWTSQLFFPVIWWKGLGSSEPNGRLNSLPGLRVLRLMYFQS